MNQVFLVLDICEHLYFDYHPFVRNHVTTHQDTMQDERQIAKQYLLDHKINRLFKRILILLLLHRPTNVKMFIVEQLQKEENLESKPLLNNEEMEVMFKMLENPVTDKGFVTGKKINDSLMAMGILDTVKEDETFNLQQFKSTLNNVLKAY